MGLLACNYIGTVLSGHVRIHMPFAAGEVLEERTRALTLRHVPLLVGGGHR